MKKFFKSLAVVLALALVITSVPATAASAASVSLKSKTVTLYSEPSTGKTEDGKVCKSYNFWKIAKLLNNFDAETMDIKLVSEDTDLVQKSNKKDMIWVADGASFGTTKVKVIVTSLSTEKVLLEKSITVKVKKNATEDTFKCDLENGSEFEVGETVAVTLSRKNTDTDARKLTCADDSVEIVDANGYGTKYNVTFTKAGKFTLVASAYQSAKYPAPTVEKEIEVVVTSDFAASATGAREITVVGSGLTKDITVKRANVTVSADSVVVSEDGTTAVITLASKITDATYVVTFGEQSVEFVGEKQRVEEIVVLENGEYVTTGKNGDKQEIYAHYDVLDQYGDSVKKNYNVNWNTSTGTITANASTGVLTISVPEANALNYGSLIVITGTYAGNGVAKSVQAQLTVGLERNVNSANVIGLIKANTKTYVDILPAGFADNAYGIVYECLDQNGFILDAAVEGLQFTSMSPLLIDSISAAETIVLGDNTYAVVWLSAGVNAANGGVAQITALSTKTGYPTNITVELDSAQVVDSFTFSAPADIIAEGEGATLTYEAFDTNGNKVTNFNALAKVVTLTNANFKLVKQNDATAVLKYVAPNNCATEFFDYPDTCVAILSSNGSSFSQTIYVKEDDKAVAVKGIKSSDVNTNILEAGSVVIKGGNLEYIDQYDRANDEAPDYFTVKINSDAVTVTDGDGVAFSGDAVIEEGLYKVAKATGFKVVAATDAAVTSETVSFVLGLYDSENNKTLAGSEKTCSITIYDITQCTSFTLNGDNNLLYNTDKSSVSLKGTLKNGGSVSVPTDYWTIPASGDNFTSAENVVTITGFDTTDQTGSFYDQSVTKADGKHPTCTKSVSVTATIIDAFGTNNTSVRDTAKLDITVAIDAKKDAKIHVAGSDLTVKATAGVITAEDLLKAAVTGVENNYGKRSWLGDWTDYSGFVSYTESTPIKVTVSKVSENEDAAGAGSITIANNGIQIDDDVLTGAEMGDTFVVTFSTETASVSVNFTVGADTTAWSTTTSNPADRTWF